MESNLPVVHMVAFHGDQIATLEQGERRFVAMKRIVENMGLAWNSQYSKLVTQNEKFNCYDIITVGLDGKSRAMLCMPIENLPLWLATINPNKIPDLAIREKVERYQAESAIVLYEYWT